MIHQVTHVDLATKCEKCNINQACTEVLLADEVVYLCDPCSRLVLQFVEFMDEE